MWRSGELLALSHRHFVMVFDRFPLANFSVNSQVQSKILSDLADELESVLDATFAGERIDGPGVQRAYGLFWLWVLGTYEVVRVFSEHQKSFSPNLNERVRAFKSEIAELRMPFAKQQLRGSNTAIKREAFVECVSKEDKDISFVVKGRIYWAREVVSRFKSLLTSIANEDVLAPLVARES